MKRIFAIALSCAGISLMGCGGGGGDSGTTAPPGTGSPSTPPSTDAPTGPVQVAWDNHFGSFAVGDIDGIMKGYDAESKIAVFNGACAGGTPGQAMKGFEVFDTEAKIKEFFTALFKQLGGDNDPVTAMEDLGPKAEAAGYVSLQEGAGVGGDVLLTWKTNSNSTPPIRDATDSFSFKADASGFTRISKHNIWKFQEVTDCADGPAMYAEPAILAPLDQAWKTHITAMGVYDEREIIKSYTATSVLQVWYSATKTLLTYRSLTGIEAWWGTLQGYGAPQIQALTLDGQPWNNVFLTWKPTNGDFFATETITWAADAQGVFKIAKHNVVFAPQQGEEVQLV